MADSRRREVGWVLAGTAAVAAVYAILFLGRDAADALMGEDGAIEYIGAAALLAAGLLFGASFLRARGTSIGLVKRLALLVLAAAFVFGAGEEISWGQRILGLETPGELSDANAQDEITFHNLSAVEDVIEVERLFQLFWVAFAVLVPVACAVSARVRATLTRLIPVFPLWLAALFAIAQVIAELAQIFFEANESLYHASLPLTTNRFEITETVVALLFVVGAYLVLRDTARERAVSSAATDRPAADRTVAG